MNPYHHYILTGIIEDQDDLSSVKQEECSQFQYYEEQPQYITYENSNLCQIISSILNINEEYVDWIARNKPTEFESMMVKAKRKFYRDKAKFRMQILQPHLYSSQQPQEPKKAKRGRKPIKCAEKQFVEDNSDHDKKTIQMIRNRISAQNSRDRKKAYLKELEQSSAITNRGNHLILKQIEELQASNEEIEIQNNNILKCIKVFKQQCLESDEQFAQEILKQLEQFESGTESSASKKVKLN
ncbi:unnamed protein product (macronuclear) [Paramecium tetraurelia]|uniref:BZIP domain-containing protein n=1 Tax=Paramecium tetraurelia TaxID=5888 RepID=A0D072_PARTE|nr:uncharacterized protein GSPATT00011991001 [Paramecium tetraurelia]CAK76439.1 unnamed protein product [Paramecium tetraurelia]|eukprot:XP_001443836.1 hypothetical protein (macronuclear) [Paramecium tetraurelia strain d4-2]